MQFLKEIKSKALTAAFQNNSKDKEKDKQTEEPIKEKGSTNFLNQIKEKALKTAIFHLGLEKKQESETSSMKKQENKTYNNEKIWKTANIEGERNDEKERQRQKKQSQEISVDSAHCFVENLVKSVQKYQKDEKMRENRARISVFSKIEAEPIYMLESSEKRILEMELEANSNQEELLVATQRLVEDQASVDRAIENVLFTGYLWTANDFQYTNIIDSSMAVITKAKYQIDNLSNLTSSFRMSLKPFLEHERRMRSLEIKQRQTKKKINLLMKIKSYSKDVLLKIENIDQAFYVERNKQKMYHHFMRKDELVGRVKILRVFKEKIMKDNLKVIELILDFIKKWIDKGAKVEKKHIEKTLIMVYFVRTEPMYTQNKLEIDFDKIYNRQKLGEQILMVKKWDSYKYVNDRSIQSKVKAFLGALSSEVSPNLRKQLINVTLTKREN